MRTPPFFLLGIAVSGCLAACADPPNQVKRTPEPMAGQGNASTPDPAPPDPPQQRTPTDAAWNALREMAKAKGLDPEVVASASLRALQDSGGGPIIAQFEQRVDGIEVFRSQVSILLTRGLKTVSMTGALVKEVRPTSRDFAADARPAIAVAVKETVAIAVDPARLSPAGKPEQDGGYQGFDIPVLKAAGGKRTAPGSARAKRVWFVQPGGLLPAYYVEVNLGFADGGAEARSFVIASSSPGAVLFRNNLTTPPVGSRR